VAAHLNAVPFLGAEKFDVNKLKFLESYIPQERILFAQIDDPYKTWEEFVAYTKEHPGEVSISSGNCHMEFKCFIFLNFLSFNF